MSGNDEKHGELDKICGTELKELSSTWFTVVDTDQDAEPTHQDDAEQFLRHRIDELGKAMPESEHSPSKETDNLSLVAG